ncbi:MAG: M24 family metallopeptidase, partial [Actinomycetota bacterium]|nr:M24 family metallopeptidase [Actinomycetota bacterium]
PDQFSTVAWAETEDPVGIVAGLVGGRIRLAISDRTWARFVLAIQDSVPRAAWLPASVVTAPLRAVKDSEEVDALRRAARAADAVAVQLLAGEIPLIDRTEAEVSRDIGERLRAAGHAYVNFAIVASGPNGASPHHEPGARRIGAGESVVCDFGGTLDGYCSDITRTVFTGTPPAEFEELYRVLQDAQASAVGAAVVGAPCEEVDGVARRTITSAGYGEYFVHRTGHGIGLEEHEDPYLVDGNGAPLEAGNAFSIEPGIYIPGQWGARIEDIVIATDAGPEALNRAHHALAVVEA